MRLTDEANRALNTDLSKEYIGEITDIPRTATTGDHINDKFNVVVYNDKGAASYDPMGIIRLLKYFFFVSDDNSLYRFWKGRYVAVSQSASERMILGIVADCGIALARSKVRDTYELALATLTYRKLHNEVTSQISKDDMMHIDYSVGDPDKILAFDNGWINLTNWYELPTPTLTPIPINFVRRKLHVDFVDYRDLTQEQRDDADYQLLRLIQPDTLQVFYQMLGYILFQREMFPPYIFHFYGPGRTGKSLICDMISDIIGEDQVSRLSILALSRQFGADGLAGKWINIATETETSQASNYTPIDTEILKKLAGGEIIHSDRKYSIDGITFRNTAKLIFASNSPFILGDPSSGMNRRIITIPFRIPQDDDSNIRECLMDKELQSWIVARALEVWMGSGSVIRISTSATLSEEAHIRTDFDSWASFISSETGADDYEGRRKYFERHPTVSDLYTLYLDYCAGEKFAHPLGKKKFNERCRLELGLAMYRAHNGYTWVPDAFEGA